MSNREELTRQAERALRLGRVDEAIAQYQDLAYLAPVDWGLVKQLADLLERAGQREGAARQFTRWADYLAVEGFHSKAAALYKKVLKLEPGDEHANWQLGEVSLELKLRADARLAFQRVAEIRQRRGDTTGAAAARERLASVEGIAAAPAAALATSSVGTAPVLAYPPMLAAPGGTATTASATVPEPTVTPAVASPPPPAAAEASVPVQEPVAAPIPPPPALPPAPAPAPAEPIADSAVDSAAVAAAPETRTDRLARLRREAADADARGDRDAEAAWLAVLAADPADAAVRIRLVRAAADRADFETAAHLAAALDASDDAAWVALVDLAYQRGRLRDLEQLTSDRVHGAERPADVLGPIDALTATRPGAARAALAAAVRAWAAASQPGHAVAALEQSEGRGLLTTELHLQWVEMCVDAGLPGLSRAQRALAGAYRGEHRLAEARAVAEDVFVRDGGAEPSRALLLDILDREGVDDPDRVFAELLAPVTLAAADEPVPDVAEPLLSWPADIDAPADIDTLFATESDVALQVPAAMTMESRATLPDVLFAAPEAVMREAAALDTQEAPAGPQGAGNTARDVEDTAQDAGSGAQAPGGRTQEAGAQETGTQETGTQETGGAKLQFDWSDLLGRDLDQWPTPVPVTSPVDVPAADVAFVAAAAPASVEAIDAPMVLPDYAAVVEPEPSQEPDATVDPEPLPAPAVPAAADTSAPADALASRIGDLRAQPLFADDAPLSPSFSTPRGWLTESGATLPAAPTGRRAPEDDFFFDDDATPARWALPSARAGGLVATLPASQGLRLDTPHAADSTDDQHETKVVDPAAADPLPDDPVVAVAVDVAPSSSPSFIEEADGSAAGDDGLGPETLMDPTELLPVEEEVDLTELLEQLKQWDPVLPEPRARRREEPLDERGPVDVALIAAREEAIGMGEAVDDATVSASPDADLPTPIEDQALIAAPLAPSPAAAAEPSDLDAVFAGMQRRTDDRVVAEQQLAAGRVFLAAGLVSEAARAFERASVEPRSRFGATLALAELHRSRGQTLEAVSWYEQASTAPVPDAAVKHAVLYDLAESLESLGETDRALGVLLDLLSQVEDYRDARARLDQLLRVDAGG